MQGPQTAEEQTPPLSLPWFDKTYLLAKSIPPDCKKSCVYADFLSRENEPLLIPGTNLGVCGFSQPDTSAIFGQKTVFFFFF